jgi:hypothetical protein
MPRSTFKFYFNSKLELEPDIVCDAKASSETKIVPVTSGSLINMTTLSPRRRRRSIFKRRDSSIQNMSFVGLSWSLFGILNRKHIGSKTSLRSEIGKERPTTQTH